MKAARFRYGRIYKAYFFEKPIVHPICVNVIARSFEEALALVREQFPERTISAFHPEDRYRLVADFDAVIIAPNLPPTEPPDIERDYNGVPKEVARGWCHSVIFEKSADEEQIQDDCAETDKQAEVKELKTLYERGTP